MLNVIDTNADVVWLSVTTVASEKGLVETRPTTDEEWARVKAGAITLAEAANLLMIPGRRVARPGEKSETPGVELEPEEMDALIAKDPPGLLRARQGAVQRGDARRRRPPRRRTPTRSSRSAKRSSIACENCHKTYWYPNEKIPELPVSK